MVVNSLDILYDHYKETYKLSKDAQEKRNKSFVLLCFLETLSFLMIVQTDTTISILTGIINKELDSQLVFGTSILQSFIWIMIAYIEIRYVQYNIYIERQYDYLSELEESISTLMKEGKIDREGKNYLNNYPAVLNVIDSFYKLLAPILFLAINIGRLVVEWRDKGVRLGVILDSVICLIILAISVLYLFRINAGMLQNLKK